MKAQSLRDPYRPMERRVTPYIDRQWRLAIPFHPSLRWMFWRRGKWCGETHYLAFRGTPGSNHKRNWGTFPASEPSCCCCLKSRFFIILICLRLNDGIKINLFINNLPRHNRKSCRNRINCWWCGCGAIFVWVYWGDVTGPLSFASTRGEEALKKVKSWLYCLLWKGWRHLYGKNDLR